MKSIKDIDLFLNCAFLELGLNLATLGTLYFKELIKIAHTKNIFDIKYKDLCYMLSKNLNINYKKIDSNIYTSINTININLAKKNFKHLFHVDFDYFYISPKKLIILFLNILENTE